ncbi:MAG: TraR/DksA C4-type zinc finger protein [Planctomycetes bacterium]|uniref:TraR/DksA family transcriptional regulator n=1 Tax=Candidatus Wunengus californicus TaxID=3367619 RepID=UPI002C352FA7|nr:TraR/DksA C4-type zinc finger protein [Planctomycetota bacterium]MBI4222391.1 TraR/DksA C4-type zinc finger protein [Planctomycetota bacterium]HLE88141.1 TraR/DksA C4-type zinc finger protein [Candidatus Brocadiaceae bacterium]
MKAEEVAQFKKLLLSLRERLVGKVDVMQGETLKKSRQDASGDLSNVPIHMADVGTDNYERDIMIELIQNGEEGVRSIDTALEKIEEGAFGICELCAKKINKERLKAVPYATLCIDCQREEETDNV